MEREKKKAPTRTLWKSHPSLQLCVHHTARFKLKSYTNTRSPTTQHAVGCGVPEKPRESTGASWQCISASYFHSFLQGKDGTYRWSHSSPYTQRSGGGRSEAQGLQRITAPNKSCQSNSSMPELDSMPANHTPPVQASQSHPTTQLITPHQSRTQLNHK